MSSRCQADASDRYIRAFDLVLSGVLVPAALPLMGFVAVMVRLFIGSPVLYASKRVGYRGVEYTHFKFRSLLSGRVCGRIFFEQDRLNLCGRWIRNLHLDELPELLSILAGRMSFVGPRPLPRDLLTGLDDEKRQQVPPGWTGPAQIWLLRNGSLNKHKQIELDNTYVDRRCLSVNLALLARTFGCLLMSKPVDLGVRSTPDRIRFGHKLTQNTKRRQD